MITSPAFRGKRYAVLGLARSGLATVEALVASGAEVTAWDEKEEARAALKSSLSRSDGEGDRPQAGGGADGGDCPSTALRAVPLPTSFARREDLVRFADPLTIDLAGFDGVVVSPGVPLNRHPIAAKARAAGVPVIGDIELFAQARAGLPPHKVVGITGTNGKSTTTALVHHILKTAGVPTTMGGNIGLPILGQEPLPEGGVYVLELSSYQIDLTFSLDCDVAVLLNVTPDHLDRYESFETYVAAKLRLFLMQTEGHYGIFNTGDEEASRAEFAHWDNSEGYRGTSVVSSWGILKNMLERLSPSLQGPHNAENAAAATEVARHLGVEDAQIAEALGTYSGLPHRMERVAEKGGVLFVNDSKATNPDSTAPALAAYPYIHWIVGGRAKTETLGPCEAQLGHVRAAYTIGESGPMFFRLLEGRVPAVAQSGTLDRAVRDAAGAAKAGEVVLLSPACASFDQFRDYEHRGQAFREAVEALA
ncbi:UDP-N-acetylmuramoyl-L-alanine--D-glutamate ligase [Sphingosinicella sp.]|uniref:UDP-N-acetylmuramoyl-L-alanine--D-glutamate ligase n=1 Tax=Sphingosinicella sp. TaxID=1917971 RepID=UPI0040375F63